MSVVNFETLLQKGLVGLGEPLYWVRRGDNHRIVILGPNQFQTEDGKIHKTPSGAAKHLIGRPVNGWSVWRNKDGHSLELLRSTYSKSD